MGDPTRFGAVCDVCGEPFDEVEWDDRHTSYVEDVHARCCEECST